MIIRLIVIVEGLNDGTQNWFHHFKGYQEARVTLMRWVGEFSGDYGGVGKK